MAEELRRSARLKKRLNPNETTEKPRKKIKVETKSKTTKSPTIEKKSKPKKSSTLTRCHWVPLDDEQYVQYHDEEWGIPQRDEVKLFEMFCLEGQQAGLSWRTVLRKREAYQSLFHHFDPKKVAAMSSKKINEILTDASIIRNRKKIESIVTNAKAYMKMKEKGENFSDFVWKFVSDQTIVMKVDKVICESEESERMSKELIKRGFSFAGPTICYSFMQACGLVNDHNTYCSLK